MYSFLRTTIALITSAGLLFGDWSTVSNINKGHKIKVETSAKRYKGTFTGASGAAITLTSQDGEVSIPRGDVLRVYSQSQSHRMRNTIIGTAVGVAIGVTLYATFGALIRNESGDDTTVLLLSPIAACAAIGAVLPTGRMVKIYDAKELLNQTPAPNPLGPARTSP